MRFSTDAMSVRKNIKTLMKTKIERNIMQKLIRCLALSMIAMGVSTSYASNATQVTGTASSTYAKTKYPMVFVHGVAGFSRAGSDPLGVDYWHVVNNSLNKLKKLLPLQDSPKSTSLVIAKVVQPFVMWLVLCQVKLRH